MNATCSTSPCAAVRAIMVDKVGRTVGVLLLLLGPSSGGKRDHQPQRRNVNQRLPTTKNDRRTKQNQTVQLAGPQSARPGRKNVATKPAPWLPQRLRLHLRGAATLSTGGGLCPPLKLKNCATTRASEPRQKDLGPPNCTGEHFSCAMGGSFPPLSLADSSPECPTIFLCTPIGCSVGPRFGL